MRFERGLTESESGGAFFLNFAPGGKSASETSAVQVGLFRIHTIAETMLKARPSLIAFARRFDDVVFGPVTQLAYSS
jgi:hypothetical protein